GPRHRSGEITHVNSSSFVVSLYPTHHPPRASLPHENTSPHHCRRHRQHLHLGAFPIRRRHVVPLDRRRRHSRKRRPRFRRKTSRHPHGRETRHRRRRRQDRRRRRRQRHDPRRGLRRSQGTCVRRRPAHHRRLRPT